MSTVKRRMWLLSTLICFGLVPSVWAALTPKQQLGKFIYFDTHLSDPAGQACASCHTPGSGFADPDRSLPVSEGVIPGRYGSRNAPSAAYASFSPKFSYSSTTGAIGGQFWDGRAATLADQAKGPFLNPVEMNNPDKAAVITKIQVSTYATLFEQVYGAGALSNVDTAYNQTADAIAAYEATAELNKFTSKFDAVRAGKAQFTMQEMRGQMLFNDKAKCSTCHVGGGMDGGMRMGGGGSTRPILFTDFRYHNLGLPKNTEFPLTSNPVDLGLGGILNISTENGKFKTAHLRNIALTGPYMHNGLFKSLKDVVHFYNTRDIPGLWPAPEVPQNVEREHVGNLGLTSAEEDAIVAFLLTLTDGYTP